MLRQRNDVVQRFRFNGSRNDFNFLLHRCGQYIRYDCGLLTQRNAGGVVIVVVGMQTLMVCDMRLPRLMDECTLLLLLLLLVDTIQIERITHFTAGDGGDAE